MKRKILFLILLFAVFFQASNGQEKNPIDSLPSYLKAWHFDKRTFETIPLEIDTNLNFYQHYNPIFRKSYASVYLGNIGSAGVSSFFFENQTQLRNSRLFTIREFKRNDFDILLSKHYAAYFLTPENIKFYNTNKPYTNIIYTTGSRSRKEQTFRIVHTQNITRYWNMGFVFNGIGSEGEYIRQKTSHKAYGFFSSLVKGRYSLHASFFNNKFEDEQNGGVALDSSNKNDDYLPVKLNNAQSTHFKRSFFLAQSIRFGKIKKHGTDSVFADSLQLAADTATHAPIASNVEKQKPKTANDSIAETDTTATETNASFVSSLFEYLRKPAKKDKYYASVNHSIRYEKNAHLYYDKNPREGFYKNIYIDSTTTDDSTYYHRLSNIFSLKLSENWNPYVRIGAYVSFTTEAVKFYNFHDFIRLINDTNYVDNSISFGLFNHLSEKWFFDLCASYYSSGYKADDYWAKLKVGRKFPVFKDTIGIYLFGLYEKAQPSFFAQRYYSNHFIWENNFGQKETKRIRLKIASKKSKLNLNLNYAELNNYVYFNTKAIPEQYNKKLTVYGASLDLALRFWLFRWYNKVFWQKSSDEAVVQLPEISAYSSFFIEKKLFKVLNLQFGFDAYYNTAWYAPRFMPATGQFYLQTKEKIENLPVVDIFVNLKLKNRALLFFKAENMTQIVTGEKIYPLYNYPTDGTAIKFGVSWWFHD